MKLEKLVNMYNRMMREQLNQKVSVFGLNESNYYYVLLVCENTGITQNNLIKMVYRKQSIVTKALNKLTADGWFIMQPDANDQRRKLIYPTKKSQSVYSEIKGITDQINDWATTSFSSNEKVELEKLLLKAVQSKLPDEQI